VDGELDRARELLADDRSHATAQEPELEHAQHDGQAADTRHPGDDRFVGLRLLDGGADSVTVPLGVPEAERIRGLEVGVALLEGALRPPSSLEAGLRPPFPSEGGSAPLPNLPPFGYAGKAGVRTSDHNLTLSGAFSEAMNSPTSLTRVGVPARSSIRRTMAEPTITPSASRPTAPTWSGWPMPNPTQTGFVVRRVRVRIRASMSRGTSRRSPVPPVPATA